MGVSAGSQGNQSGQELSRPQGQAFGQRRALADRQTRASSGVWSLVTGVSRGLGRPCKEFKCQLGQSAKGQCQKSVWMKPENQKESEKKNWGLRVLQTANDQKDRCPQ